MGVVYAISKNPPYSVHSYVVCYKTFHTDALHLASSSVLWDTHTSHSLSHFVSKFLPLLSTFDPLIFPLSQHTLTLRSSHQRQAHSDGVLTHATLLQRLLQVDNLPAACVQCMCVFALHKPVVFAGGCEDITGLLLYSGESLPPLLLLIPLTPPTPTREMRLDMAVFSLILNLALVLLL